MNSAGGGFRHTKRAFILSVRVGVLRPTTVLVEDIRINFNMGIEQLHNPGEDISIQTSLLRYIVMSTSYFGLLLPCKPVGFTAASPSSRASPEQVRRARLASRSCSKYLLPKL